MNPVQKYDALRQVANDLWVMDGEWFDSPFKRRMTVIRLGSKELFVHNPFCLLDADYKTLDSLGKVKYIVAPNVYHESECHLFKAKYSEAELYVSSAALKSVKKRCKVDGVLPSAISPTLRKEVDCLEIQGTRLLGETVFFHRATRTLIVTDLVFNLQNEVQGFQKKFFAWNQIYKRFGPSRIFKWTFLKSKAEMKASLLKVLEWNFERVIMNHGEVLESNGKASLIRGFKEIGIQL